MAPISTLHDTTKGLRPLDEPLAGVAIEERLRSEREENGGERAKAAATRLRCSDAYSCARKLAFSSIGLPKDITYDQKQIMTFRAGDFYHQVTQEALVRTFDARIEVPVDWTPRGISLSGHCDAVYQGASGVAGYQPVAVEIKSQSGYGFDVAVGARKGRELPGPKVDHLIQAGLYALAPQIEATAIHIIYINKDRGSVAEWLIPIDDPLVHVEHTPSVRDLVDKEIDRMHGVLNRLDHGELPRRVIPGYGLVDDPPPAGSRDDPWNCRYCPWQPTCSELPADVIHNGVATVKQAKGDAQ